MWKFYFSGNLLYDESVFPLIKYRESSPRWLASIFIYFPYIVIHSRKKKKPVSKGPLNKNTFH